ncbi:hypothetical protein [Lacticaseibacillus jixiensis]|uniref:hypothetical protein n=1 Tax=Lacticaseibacillus jixiensis TaxID=3231926 RepID=UPI0036F2E8CA
MTALRQRILIIITSLLLVLSGGFWFAQNTPTVAAGADDLTLVGDIGLPKDVVQVMLDNSLDASGHTPTVSADAVTVKDISTWQTVSLANRVAKGGDYQSSTNSTVAGWIGSLVTNDSNYVETKDMILYQDVALNNGGNYSANAILTTEIPMGYGRPASYTATQVPIYNKLMAVLMSATSAKTIDITGLVSRVSDASARVKMLAMFRTCDMAHLTELDLGSNNFGAGIGGSGWSYNVFQLTTLSSNSVETWDLSFEGLTGLDSVLLQHIGSQTKNVNLASNSLNKMDWNNSGFLKSASNDGVLNLDANTEIDSQDSTTLTVLMKLLGNGGSTVLPEEVANSVITAAFVTDNYELTVAALNQVLPQLSPETLATLVQVAAKNEYSKAANIFKDPALDVAALPASTLQDLDSKTFDSLLNVVDKTNVDKLADKHEGGGTVADPASLSVNGNWTFDYTLGADSTNIKSDDIVSLSGLIPAGQRLQVSMSTWVSGSYELRPTLSFMQGAKQLAIIAGDPAITVISNSSTTALTLSSSLESARLRIPTDELSQLAPKQAYSSKVTWTIENVPDANAK